MHKHVHVFKERICNPERAQTVDEFEHFGTGSGFYIQNGTGIQSVIEIPRDEHELQRNHPWKAEKCFWTQGDNPLHTINNLLPLYLKKNNFLVFMVLRLINTCHHK